MKMVARFYDIENIRNNFSIDLISLIPTCEYEGIPGTVDCIEYINERLQTPAWRLESVSNCPIAFDVSDYVNNVETMYENLDNLIILARQVEEVKNKKELNEFANWITNNAWRCEVEDYLDTYRKEKISGNIKADSLMKILNRMARECHYNCKMTNVTREEVQKNIDSLREQIIALV